MVDKPVDRSRRRVRKRQEGTLAAIRMAAMDFPVASKLVDQEPHDVIVTESMSVAHANAMGSDPKSRFWRVYDLTRRIR